MAQPRAMIGIMLPSSLPLLGGALVLCVGAFLGADAIAEVRAFSGEHAVPPPAAEEIREIVASNDSAASIPASHPPPNTEVFEGPALVLDGDTIKIGNRTVRLFGIDAPEISDWPLGAYAKAKLREYIAGQPVRCERVGTDRGKRIVALCMVDNENASCERHPGVCKLGDLGAAMIYLGYAVVHTKSLAAFHPKSLRHDYWVLEWGATTKGRGIWKDYP